MRFNVPLFSAFPLVPPLVPSADIVVLRFEVTVFPVSTIAVPSLVTRSWASVLILENLGFPTRFTFSPSVTFEPAAP